MQEQPLISIIIPNYNGIEMLKACLDSLEAQSYRNLEIILVDNGSNDGSAKFVRENYPAIKIIANNSNLGYVLAANQGIESSLGEFVVVLNNDTRADPKWIEHLVRVALADNNIGICASKQLNFFDPGIIDSAGIQLCRGGYPKDRGRHEKDLGQFNTLGEVFAAPGASAFYRRTMLDQIGLFDSDYFAYCEEFDLAFRARLSGWKCLYVPEAMIYHMSGQTRARQDEKFLIYHVERNRLLTIIKNYPVRMFLYCLPFFLKYELDILIRLITRFEKEVLIARIDALKLLPKMLAKRNLIQRKRMVSACSLRRFIMSKNR
jgi:hypothetical protein